MGGESFKDVIRGEFSSLLYRAQDPGAKALMPEAERVMAAVGRYYGVSRQELMRSRRGISNPARDAAIYLIRTLCRMTLPEAGRVFGIKNDSSVSSAVQRAKREMGSGDKMAKTLAAISRELHKKAKS